MIAVQLIPDFEYVTRCFTVHVVYYGFLRGGAGQGGATGAAAQSGGVTGVLGRRNERTSAGVLKSQERGGERDGRSGAQRTILRARTYYVRTTARGWRINDDCKMMKSCAV